VTGWSVFDNLVVARVASLLNVPSIGVRKRDGREACLAKTLFLFLD
jgi:hypothetical protein